MSSTILNVHTHINDKLDYFIQVNKIPNIIFHGPPGSGKRTLVDSFIKKIYNNDRKIIKNYVMNIDCGHGKGIKFIREDLKFFSKTNIHSISNMQTFKSIVLLNADKLTIDAQSALRRCIELFSHSTRFFIVVEDKSKLLRPILSRFCDIFVPLPIIKNESINLHAYKLDEIYGKPTTVVKSITDYVKKQMNGIHKITDNLELIKMTNKFYDKGISSIDILKYIENCKNIEPLKKYTLLTFFEKTKKEFRNEKLFMFSIFNFMLIRNNDDLENISFM